MLVSKYYQNTAMKKIILMTLALSVVLLTSCSNDAKKKEEQQRKCNAVYTSCNDGCAPITNPDTVTPAITTPATCTCGDPIAAGFPAGSTSTLQGACTAGAACIIRDSGGAQIGIAPVASYTAGTTTPGTTIPGETVENTQCLQNCTDALNQCSPY